MNDKMKKAIYVFCAAACALVLRLWEPINFWIMVLIVTMLIIHSSLRKKELQASWE